MSTEEEFPRLMAVVGRIDGTALEQGATVDVTGTGDQVKDWLETGLRDQIRIVLGPLAGLRKIRWSRREFIDLTPQDDSTDDSFSWSAP